MTAHARNVRVRPRQVPLESALRYSSETDARIVHAAHLSAAQKRAFHATVHRSSAAAKAIAEESGISYQFLVNAANASTHDQLPFARLPLVLEACDDLTLLRFLADRQHCDVLRRPRVGTASDIQRASVTIREFSQFIEAGAEAMADAVIEPGEFARVEREGLEAIEAIRDLIADYRRRVRRPLLDEAAQ